MSRVWGLPCAESERSASWVPPAFHRYEVTRLLGFRALQLAYGAPPLVRLPLQTPLSDLQIAELELQAGVLPLKVCYADASLRQSSQLSDYARTWVWPDLKATQQPSRFREAPLEPGFVLHPPSSSPS